MASAEFYDLIYAVVSGTGLDADHDAEGLTDRGLYVARIATIES